MIIIDNNDAMTNEDIRIIYYIEYIDDGWTSVNEISEKR